LNKIILFISLFRVKQWYKNIIIFFGIVFGLELLSPENFFVSVLGFISLCLITSSVYIRNDILDFELDKLHPEKRTRPVPSGKITIRDANIIFFTILSLGLVLSFYLDIWFAILMVALFVNTEIYSRITKNIVFLDVFEIGINFVIRAVSGVMLIKTAISPWIVLGVFFVALFLGFMKRKSELINSESTPNHRKVLKNYSKITLSLAEFISGVMVIGTYSLYTIIGPYNGKLILTVPLIIVVVIRQLYLSKINHPLIQKNEFYRDKLSAIILIAYSILTLILLYTDFLNNFDLEWFSKR
jgi:4-hydroxybenzoate polyprenyltransferase